MSTAAEFASREQGYSSAPVSRVDLPFRLSRLPQKRAHMCTLGYEGTGYWADVKLDLAPPVQRRPWWSVWSFTHESAWDGPSNNYAGQPVAFLQSVDGDSESDVALYLLMKVVEMCSLGCEEIRSGTLDELQIQAALLALDNGDCDSGAKGALDVDQREQIIACALPDLREIVSERLGQLQHKKG